jgi:hypothetical protein
LLLHNRLAYCSTPVTTAKGNAGGAKFPFRWVRRFSGRSAAVFAEQALAAGSLRDSNLRPGLPSTENRIAPQFVPRGQINALIPEAYASPVAEV